MRAGDEQGLVEKEEATSPFHSRILLADDPACRPLAFSIVLTNREPGKGYPDIKHEIQLSCLSLKALSSMHTGIVTFAFKCVHNNTPDLNRSKLPLAGQ